MQDENRLAHLLGQGVQGTGGHDLQIDVEVSGWTLGFHSERRR
jgi:hypothetical protein